MGRMEKKKKIKEKSTVPTSISNTVAHAAIFKPDAGLGERSEKERGMEWGVRSPASEEEREALWKKCGLS